MEDNLASCDNISEKIFQIEEKMKELNQLKILLKKLILDCKYDNTTNSAKKNCPTLVNIYY